MICHDILHQFPQSFSGCLQLLACRALLFGAPRSPKTSTQCGFKAPVPLVDSLVASLQLLPILWANSAAGCGPEKTSKHRLLGTFKLTIWRLQWACSCKMRPLLGLLDTCNAIVFQYPICCGTMQGGHMARFCLKSALFKKPLELRLASCMKRSSLRN